MLPCGVPHNLLKLFLGIQNNFLVHNYYIYYLKQKNRWLPDSMHKLNTMHARTFVLSRVFSHCDPKGQYFTVENPSISRRGGC